MRRPPSLGAMRALAALLLVDGRVLPARELAAIGLPCGATVSALRCRWMPRLRAAGCQVETVDFRGSGYRLLELPPDALLDDVLTVAHQLRREQPTRLWAAFGRCWSARPSLTSLSA